MRCDKRSCGTALVQDGAMTLGFRGHDDWRDMSEYVVHFTKKSDDALSALFQILSSGRIDALQEFGSARNCGMEDPTQRSACFAEIPLEYLERLVTRRSSYGVAFRKTQIVEGGGGRVWYVEKDSAVHGGVKAAKAAATGRPGDPIWHLTPFIDTRAPTATPCIDSSGSVGGASRAGSSLRWAKSSFCIFPKLITSRRGRSFNKFSRKIREQRTSARISIRGGMKTDYARPFVPPTPSRKETRRSGPVGPLSPLARWIPGTRVSDN